MTHELDRRLTHIVFFEQVRLLITLLNRSVPINNTVQGKIPLMFATYFRAVDLSYDYDVNSLLLEPEVI